MINYCVKVRIAKYCKRNWIWWLCVYLAYCITIITAAQQWALYYLLTARYDAGTSWCAFHKSHTKEGHYYLYLLLRDNMAQKIIELEKALQPASTKALHTHLVLKLWAIASCDAIYVFLVRWWKILRHFYFLLTSGLVWFLWSAFDELISPQNYCYETALFSSSHSPVKNCQGENFAKWVRCCLELPPPTPLCLQLSTNTASGTLMTVRVSGSAMCGKPWLSSCFWLWTVLPLTVVSTCKMNHQMGVQMHSDFQIK